MGMNRKRKVNRSIIIILILVMLMSSVAYVVYHPAFLFNAAAGLITSELLDDETGYPFGRVEGGDQAFNRDVVNIVFLGFDRVEYRLNEYDIYRPDTIMVASLNFRTAEVSLVHIPRDSYVKIYGTEKYDKINHAYMYGYYGAEEGQDRHLSGLKKTLLTIKAFLGGVTIHEFVVTDIDGAINVIDELGGLYYDVDIDVRADLGRGEVVLEKGYQHLNGWDTMLYARNRADYQGGERARTERQQQVMIALFKQLKKEGRLSDITGLYKALEKNIETEMNMPQIAALSIFGMRVDAAAINSYVFAGEGRLSNQNGRNIWFLVIDENKRVTLIEEIFGVRVEKNPEVYLPEPLVHVPEDESEYVWEPEPESEAEPEPEPEPESEPESESEPAPEAEPEPESEPEPEDDSEPVPEEETGEEKEEGTDTDHQPEEESGERTTIESDYKSDEVPGEEPEEDPEEEPETG